MPLSPRFWKSQRISERQAASAPQNAAKPPHRRGHAFLSAGLVLGLCILATPLSFAREQVTLSSQPLSFEANQGQLGNDEAFLARGKGYLLYIRPREATLALQSAYGADHKIKAIRMRLLGAADRATTTGLTPLPGRHNYYVGNDPARWHTNIPTYAKVAANGVYPGIDMVYYGKDGLLEYDFKVAANADPRTIRLGFDGADKLSVTAKGELLITAGKAQLVQHVPYAYQTIAGKQVPVAARYTLRNRTVGLALGDYDHQRPLIIDPALAYSSYLGGSRDDKALAVAVDGDGNIYVTGSTLSSDFPGASATNTFLSSSENTDVFVTKLSKTGSVIFTTYMGATGSNEPIGGEKGDAIAVANIGGQNKIYVTGGTAYNATGAGGIPFPTSSNPYKVCPITNGDAFVTVLDANSGQMNYSTCIGGGLSEEGLGIAVDSTGKADVVGYSTSLSVNPFPTTPGAVQETSDLPQGLYTSFFFKLDPDNTKAPVDQLMYSTYMGCALSKANCGTGSTYATAVAVDGNGIAYVAGYTGTSADKFPTGVFTATSYTPYQPTLNGTQDAFFFKLDPAGNGISDLLYASYLGGSDPGTGAIIDKATGIAVDSSGDIYISGATTSSDFPRVNAIQTTYGGGSILGDAFVAKFSATTAGGNDYGPSYITYVGGSGEDGATAIAVDSATGRAYITGSTTSTDFPIQAATNLQAAFNLNYNASAKDAFVTSIEPSSTAPGYALHYSTYLGGELDDQGQGIAVAANDKAYVVGYTPSFKFPVTSDAAQPDNQSNAQTGGLGFDAFVARIAPVANLSVTIAAHPTNDLQGDTAPAINDSLTYSLVVANLGPDPATGITLTFDLSVADALYLPSYDNKICQYDGHKLFTCALSDLAAGSSQTLSFAGTLTTGNPLVATATLSSNELVNAVSTSYTLTASQTLPPPSTVVTGGSTPTATTPSVSGGGGGIMSGTTLFLLGLAVLGRMTRLRIKGFNRDKSDALISHLM